MILQIHGPNTPTRWIQDPTMKANLEFTTEPYRVGDNASAVINLSLASLPGSNYSTEGYFGYYIGLLATLTTSPVDVSSSSAEASYSDTDMMISKPNSDSRWSSTDYTATNQTISVTGLSDDARTVYLTVYLRSDCTCVSGGTVKHTYPVYCQPYSIAAKTYTVTFYDYQGGSVVSTQTIEYGQNATPPVVTREGYNFLGWSDSYTNITTNKTIYGQWELANPKVWIYTTSGWKLVPYVYNYTASGWKKIT